MVVVVQTRIGEFSINECENGVHITLPDTKLDGKDITIEMPQCNVPGVVSNYELSVKHFAEEEKDGAIKVMRRYGKVISPHKCEDCGKVGEDVELTVCPYEQDVHNEDVEVWLCTSCYNIRADDI